MQINLNKAYTPQVGDILSWASGIEKILFVVLENKTNELRGVTLFDSRYSYRKAHTIFFAEKEFNYRLHLVCKNDRAYFDLDQILDDWREENE